MLWVPDLRPDRSHRFDVLGIVLCCLGLGLVVFGVQNGEHYHWGRVAGPITIAEIIAAGVLFVASSCCGRRPRATRNRCCRCASSATANFSLGNIANVIIGFSVTGLFVPLVLFVQTVPKLSAFETGLLTAPTSLMSGVVAFFAGRLSNRADAKYLPITGFTLLGRGILAMTFLLRGRLAWVLLPSMVAWASAWGWSFTAHQHRHATLDPRLMGAGAGIYNTSRQFGNVLGSAGTGAVLQVTLAATGDFTTADARLVAHAGRVHGHRGDRGGADEGAKSACKTRACV